MKLTESLQDHSQTNQLWELYYKIYSKIKAMKLNKHTLKDSLSHELQVIHWQHEEFDRKQKALIAKILMKDVRRIFNEELES